MDNEISLQAADILTMLKYPSITVYLSGSKFDGFGHTLSDIDIYAITEENFGSDREIHIEFSELSGHRFDIEYWQKSKLEYLIEQLEKYSKSEFNEDTLPSINKQERNFLHRVLIGVPLLGDLMLEDIQCRINKKALSFLNYQVNSDNFQGLHEDTVGLMESNDFHSALLALNHAAQVALEAYLSIVGENYISEKWTFRKIQKIGRDDMYMSYLKLLQGPGNSDLKSFIEFNLDLFSQYITEAQAKTGWTNE